MSNKRLSLNKQQAGIASILFTLVMMIVISLIVLSFAQLARRGQRENLDAQLSTQAYYAAESGVNDAVQILNDSIKHGVADLSKPTCALTGAYSSSVMHPDLGTGVSYTCLKVNTTPGSLVTKLSTTSSKVLTINPVNHLDSLTLTWTPTPAEANGSTNISHCPAPTDTKFPTTGSWNCPYGMLRFDLIPTSGTLTRNDMTTKAIAVYAVPTNSGASNTISFAGNQGQGLRSNAVCTVSVCTLKITFPAGGITNYAMRVMSKYAAVPLLTVTGQSSAVLGDVLFKDGQALIDSTGKAQDVYRRIQVRVPLRGASGGYADYAIGSQESICKRFTVSPGYFSDDDSPSANGSLCKVVD